jgi:predicted  nucleic acid-binding Zn-ribbon protein
MNDNQDIFIKSTRILSESSIDNPTASHAEQLKAIKQLKDAPLLEDWDKALLQGLRSPDSDIVLQTVEACIYRLHHSSDAEWQDRFMKAILDDCLFNLSGRSRRPHSSNPQQVTQHEQAAAQLIQAIDNYLRKHPLQMEHHRSRILLNAPKIKHLLAEQDETKHLKKKADLADALVEFQYALGKEDSRSDNMVAAELHLLRKIESYQSPKTSESTLRAYLKQDKQLPLENISQELFQNYRFLLNSHAKENAYKALLESMDNVIHWLDNIPWHGEGSDALVGEVLKNVRLRKPSWDELTLPVKRHLEAQLELLPGRDHPEDLLNLLRTKYAAFDVKKSEDILIRGLEVLLRCPIIRYRVNDLYDFINDPGKKQRSDQVWYAFLALVEKLLTGLADFRLVDQKVLGKEETKRNKAMEQILAPDKKLRTLLQQISLEETWIAASVRESAWRILLRSLPQERNDLYTKGLRVENGRFFVATLEEAAQQHQRSLWELLMTEWDQFVSVEVPTEERQARIKAIADYFQQTRVYEGVQNDGQIGPMLQLALDDQEQAVRQFAEQAIISSGYALELQRERQKRNVLQLSDEFTDNYQQVITFENRFSELSNQVNEVQTRRADHALQIQALLQERDCLVTEGWITTSNLQVDLGEVREILNKTLKEARRQLGILEELQQRINEELRHSRQAYRETEQLVSEQKSYERKLNNLRQQLSNAQSSLRQYQSEANAAERELSRLNNSFPSQPHIPNDPEEAQRVRREHDYAVSEHQRRVKKQQNTVNQLYRRINDCESEINSCRNGITQAENKFERLQQKINQIRTRIREIERQIEGLRVEFRRGQATWEALRSEINHLYQQAHAIEAKYTDEQQRTQRKVNQNTATYDNEQVALNQVNTQLQQLHTQVNATTEKLDYHKTRSQELRQAIESGQQNYDEVGTQADQQSRQADATGVSLQAREEQKTQKNQESGVFYAHGINKELETQPRPPTLEERPKPKKRSSPSQRTTK